MKVRLGRNEIQGYLVSRPMLEPGELLRTDGAVPDMPLERLRVERGLAQTEKCGITQVIYPGYRVADSLEQGFVRTLISNRFLLPL